MSAVERVDIKVIDAGFLINVVKRCTLAQSDANDSIQVEPGPLRIASEEIVAVATGYGRQSLQVCDGDCAKRPSFWTYVAHIRSASLQLGVELWQPNGWAQLVCGSRSELQILWSPAVGEVSGHHPIGPAEVTKSRLDQVCHLGIRSALK
jgi:hypothetical protein